MIFKIGLMGMSKAVQFLIGAAIILAFLVIGRTFLVPIALAVLIVILFQAIVERIMMVHFSGRQCPQWLAVLGAFAIIMVGFWFIVSILSNQASQVVAAAPGYITRFETLISQFLTKIDSNFANDIRKAISSLNIVGQISHIAGSAGNMLLSFVLVALYAGFLIAERAIFPQKLVSLYEGTQYAGQIPDILRAISAGIRQYMWIKTLLSLLTGLISYIVMRSFGLDFAEIFAMLIFLLNFIPNIGATLAVMFPAFLGLVQFSSLSSFFFMTLILIVIQFIVGNFLEPRMMGKSLNLSPFVIVLALTFWGTIWGIIGMFMSVPIMVTILIICAHVPAWHSIAILLSADGDIKQR